VTLRKPFGKILIVMVALVSAVFVGGRPGQAQAPPSKAVPLDGYQRSADNYVFKATATSGPQRGEELYYYKCWYCHNIFAKRAPYLKDLFQRPNMTDQTVADRIRKGGPLMPSYETTLDAAAIADLVSYLKEKCCWEGENEPPNPRYVLGTKR
jgi:cytochrome c5